MNRKINHSNSSASDLAGHDSEMLVNSEYGGREKGREIGFNRGVGSFLIIYQTLFILGLPVYLYFGTVHLSTALIAFVLFFLTGISITAGYHRYYAHRSYKAHPVIEPIVLFFATLATQASAIRWSFDHRLHHAYVDTDRDPYSICKGFWYAHFLWLMEKPRTVEPKVVSDLYENRLLVLQDRYYLPLVIGLNAAVCIFFGWLLSDFWGAFFLITWGRMFALHHSTWFINSLAHTWGDKPFSQEQSAVNNYVISFLTFGEGYHNYHHTYANDYRNGVRWYHFDPTKWLIWTLHKLGLAWNLKKIDPAIVKKRMVIEHKRLLSEKIKVLWGEKCDEVQARIDELSSQIIEKLNKLSELKNKLSLPDVQNSDLLRSVQEELNQLQKSVSDDWNAWVKLSRQIMRNQNPLKA